MNAAEQRRQHTVSQRLDQTAENLAVLFNGLDARVFDLFEKWQQTQRDVNTLRDVNLKTHDELWVRINEIIGVQRTLDQQQYTRLVSLDAKFAAVVLDFHGRTFWQRLVWLFTGR